MNQDFSDNYRKSLDFGVVKSNVVKAVLSGQVPTRECRHLDANLALGDCVQEHSSWILTFVSDTLRVRRAEREQEEVRHDGTRQCFLAKHVVTG